MNRAPIRLAGLFRFAVCVLARTTTARPRRRSPSPKDRTESPFLRSDRRMSAGCRETAVTNAVRAESMNSGRSDADHADGISSRVRDLWILALDERLKIRQNSGIADAP